MILSQKEKFFKVPLLLFLFNIPICSLAASADKKETKQTEIDHLKKLIALFDSADKERMEMQRTSLGKLLLRYPTTNLRTPLEITIPGKTITLKRIEAGVIGLAKHYVFVTESKKYSESDGTPWERKDFMVINIEKNGRPESPSFSSTSTLMCVENGYNLDGTCKKP